MALEPAYIAYPTALVLLVLAGFHAFWGVGGYWPGSDEASLVEHIIGRTPNMNVPSFWACMFVAGCLLAVVALIFARMNFMPLPNLISWLPVVGLYAASAIFIVRGFAAYLPKVFDYAKGTPFYDLNLVFYSPLCIAIGVALIALNLMRT